MTSLQPSKYDQCSANEKLKTCMPYLFNKFT